jgi:GT2 family glycosyltransferase
MRNPKVIVLILSYNGKHLLDDSVFSYLENDYPNFKVVVIDNGSSDGTEDYVEKNFPEAKVIRLEKNQGYSGGFNFGLKYAFEENNADYVLITNNDVKADKKVISELVKVAETDSKIGFVIGKVYYYDNPKVLQTVGKREDPIRWKGEHIGNREIDTGQYDKVEERVFCDDIFWLVRRDLYEKTGGYDTTFFLQAEDYDWQARAKKLGYKIMYTPFAKIRHKDSMTIGKTSPLKAFYDARNPMLVILKHKSPDFFRRYFWLHFRKDIFMTSIKIIIKRFEIKKAYNIWTGFLSGICWGLKNKKFTIKHFH